MPSWAMPRCRAKVGSAATEQSDHARDVHRRLWERARDDVARHERERLLRELPSYEAPSDEARAPVRERAALQMTT